MPRRLRKRRSRVPITCARCTFETFESELSKESIGRVKYSSCRGVLHRIQVPFLGYWRWLHCWLVIVSLSRIDGRNLRLGMAFLSHAVGKIVGLERTDEVWR